MLYNDQIMIAISADLPALELLVNSAYRGDSSKKGWTTEADLLDGIRTNQASLATTLQNPDAVILKYINTQGNILGCVYLQKKGSKLYLSTSTKQSFAPAFALFS